MAITFRSSRIVYYGPHSCENCGATIAKMGQEWGGTAFTYPEGPIYPNTEWHPHVCDPATVKRKASPAKENPPLPAEGICGLCGKAMPAGEEMFNYHGYSGPCPNS